MASYENVNTISAVAGADLSDKQYFFVKQDSTDNQVVVCGDGELALGVLLNDPTSGLAASVAVSGKVKVEAGGSVTVGARVASDAAGNAVAAATADYVAGVAMTGGDDGDIIEVLLGLTSIEPA